MPFPRSPGTGAEDAAVVEVLVEGAWHAGELRSWDRDDDGHWSAMVTWSIGPGASSHLERFPAEQIRPDPPLPTTD